jgi:hypothetical protein
MKDPVNMLEVVAELRQRPRGRACVVLTSDFAGQKDWVAKLASQTDSSHVHVLDIFAGDITLSDKINSFLIPDFFRWLLGYASKPVLIVSGFEFLLASWSGQATAMEDFAAKVEMWNSKTSALLFVTQFDRYIAERKFTRYRDKVFVINQKDTLALV